MLSGTSSSDEKISTAKIEPLASDQKEGVPLDMSSRGAIGSDRIIDQSRIDPAGGRGQYQHPEPHADSQGVVGRDETIHGAKIEPLEGGRNTSTSKQPGLDDEQVDASRISPMGEVREEMS